MLNPFVCGTFHHEDEHGYGVPCSSPKKSKRKDSRDNNPYSNRGLDKFSALLEDLNERRQKVYSQMSPQDISFVRFAYSSNDDIVPIVVKLKNKEQRKHKSEELRARHLTPFLEQFDKFDEASMEERKQQKNYRFCWNAMLKRPSFYVPLVMILILLFLIVFGRSVAILCTCVMWYVVPTLSEPRTLMKKKHYLRGLSEKHLQANNENADSKASSDDNKSSAKHGHQKSW
ncbi:hypothetical protein VNO77_11142 [Canavalia gladiata]|uniref:ZCF37 n=1 Tax=Canavalia gladiata TaxID=3824 RepID=A0AAN9MBU6_CANGL